MTTLDIVPPTFPMRPLNGGPWPKARRFARPGMYYEPKYNGWRALVHIATGAMFNRHGERLSIEKEFEAALNQLRPQLDAEAFKWADCEALERRHGIGKGCLIVLDVIPSPAFRPAPYSERHDWLKAVLPESARAGFPLLSVPPQVEPDSAWLDLQEANRVLGCEFYEGLVAKRGDSPYTIQNRSSDTETPFWIKMRWRF